MTLSPEQEALEARLAEIGESFPGVVGIGVAEVSSEAVMSYNGDVPMPQQSVSKLWVSMTALDLVDRGKLDLAEPVVIRAQDLTLFHQPIREIVKAKGQFVTTYRELMQRAITQSDNTANDRILRRAGGPKAVDKFIAKNHLQGVAFGTDERTKQAAIAGLSWQPSYSVGRRFYDAREAVPDERRKAAFEGYLADPIDGATPSGMAEALAKLARGDLLSKRSTELLVGIMNKTKSGPRRLKGGVPPDWAIAHKTGTGQVYAGEQSGYNDVAILFSPTGRKYGVAAFIQRTRSSYAERFAMMQAVTRAVVAYDEGFAPSVPAAGSTSSRPPQAASTPQS
ncbi:serine hydrolase [Erythrobacter litoralis]|nr:serine hydrolase [Erythrobacter litoralis]